MRRIFPTKMPKIVSPTLERIAKEYPEYFEQYRTRPNVVAHEHIIHDNIIVTFTYTYFIRNENDPVEYWQMRSLTFVLAPTGELTKYHKLDKFFNDTEWDEKNLTCLFDSASRIQFANKLDGSLIAGIILVDAAAQKHLVLLSMSGATEFALDVTEKFYRPEYYELVSAMQRLGYMPLFEYCAADNQIVVKYDTPTLTLIAARNRNDLSFMEYSDIQTLSERFRVPYVSVKTMTAPSSATMFEKIKKWKELVGIEGFVLRIEVNNAVTFIKVKTHEYYQKISPGFFEHRTRDSATKLTPDKLMKMIVEETFDDLLGFLEPDVKKALLKLIETIYKRMSATFDEVHEVIKKSESRRDIFVTLGKNRVKSGLANAMLKNHGIELLPAFRQLTSTALTTFCTADEFKFI